MNKKILALGLSLIVALSASFVLQALPQGRDAQTEQSGDKDGKASAIKHIDAMYLRKHIFDYKANPNKFVFKGTRPAVIDFYADWCGPCRQLSPRLEAIASKYADKIDVYKVDIDSEAELAKVFGVKSIPMLLFIGTDGSTPAVSTGVLSNEDLEKEVQRILQKP